MDGGTASDRQAALSKTRLSVRDGLLSKSNIQRMEKSILTRRFLRKEVIQPQVPLRLPCYDFTPVADLTVVGCFQ